MGDATRRDKFGQRLYSARNAVGLSQEALAEALGVSKRAVQRWESGEDRPKIDRLEAIGACLGRPPAWFLLSDDSQEHRQQLSCLMEMAGLHAGAMDAQVPTTPAAGPSIERQEQELQQKRQAAPPRQVSPEQLGGALPSAAEMWALVTQVVQCQADIAQAVTRLTEEGAESREKMDEMVSGLRQVVRAVDSLAAQERGQAADYGRRLA